MKKIILLGCGGHAKSVVDAIESKGEYEIAGFLDNKEFCYRGYDVIGADEAAEKLFKDGVQYAFISIGYMGNGRLRERLYAYVKDIGFELPVIVDSSAVIASDVQIGEGTFIGKNSVINANAKIGKLAIVNTGAIIEHDCKVGEFSHISVGAVLCGNVVVGDSCFIGAGTTAIQGIDVADNVIVGAGSVILKNIEKNSMSYGLIKSKKGGRHRLSDAYTPIFFENVSIFREGVAA